MLTIRNAFENEQNQNDLTLNDTYFTNDSVKAYTKNEPKYQIIVHGLTPHKKTQQYNT